MSKVIIQHCEKCGIPFKTEKSRFCSRECRSGIYKGGKTFLEKEKDDISRINSNWASRKYPYANRKNPDSITFTNY